MTSALLCSARKTEFGTERTESRVRGHTGEKALKNALGECGIEIVDISGGYDFSKPDEHCKRWYITAKKVRNIR